MSSQASSKLTSNLVARKLYRDLYHYVTKLNQQEQVVQIQSLITTSKYYNTTNIKHDNDGSSSQLTSSVAYNPKRNLQQMEELLQKHKQILSSNSQKNRKLSANDDADDDGLLRVENSKRMKQLLADELRFHFRQTDLMTSTAENDNNHDTNDVLQQQIKLGQSKLSLLRMTTNVKPRKIYDGTDESSSDKGRSSRRIWIYRDGQKFEQTDGGMDTSTQQRKAMSSFDGKNLDPQSVTTHRKLLRRAGFVNNQHAKGIF